MTGSMLTFPLTAKWRIATVLLLVVILFMALASPFNLHVPASAEGTDPTATVTPTGTSTPTSTPEPAVPTAPSDADSDEAQTAVLFSEVEREPPVSTDAETIASRLVGIDFGQIAQITNPPIDPKDPATGKPTTPQTLVLNLFDDVVFTGIVEHVEPTASGHALWGSIEGVEFGAMTLVVNGKVVVGTVRTLGAVYTIRTAGDGKYVIRQIDESSLPPLGEPLEDSLSPRDPRTESDDVAPDDGSVIDLMVMYTPLAKHHEGGRAAIEALIDLFVTETNQALAKSGVIHRINLVLRDEVDYIEKGGDFLTDIYRFQGDSDGYMDHVHELRDMYAADLVHLVVGRSGVGGRAYIAYDESVAFGLTAAYRKDLAFPHEIGHNMGLHHDRYEVGVPLTGSNYGYVNQQAFEPGAPESARWNTIMAYPNQCSDVLDSWCAWLPYFSNPDKTYKGDPMGVPADHPSTGVDGPADAVGILNDRREIMANYRPSSTSPIPRMGLALSQYWLPEQGGVSTVTATLHRPSSEDTVVKILASPSDAVTLNENGMLTIPAGETVSRGGVTITGVNNGDQTGDVIVEVSATAENPSSLGVIGPEPVELVIADDETTPAVTLSLSPVEIVEGGEWPENRTVVAAALDNRSNVDTTIAVSATPADAVEEIYSDTLTIPAGQRASIGFGVRIYALDDNIRSEAQKSVTVSGTARNTHGVTGPESVTLTIIDDEAPYFAHDSITYTFTQGVAGGRFLPEAAYGNGELTYSLSPTPGSEVTFTPGPPARIGVPASLQAGREGSYTLTATDADGDSDTMTIIIAVREAVCPNSAAVAGYSNPEVVSDCEAMLASLDALSVDRTLNWDKDLPIGEWEGVEVRGSRVVLLSIANEDIAGTIPSELGNLDSLQFLNLRTNGLKGGIPKELGNLANLRVLNLRENQLTGEIPTELGDLTELTELLLGVNRLTGEIPTELGSLVELRSINLVSNQLTGEIPKELGNLSNLERIYLNGNQLTGEIPKELGDLSELIWLSLRDNRLTGEIPPELGNLSDLQHLNLSDNNLTGGIPTELGDLSNLDELYLGGNRLAGCVPDELRDIPYNDFAGLGLPFCVVLACSTLAGASSGANNPGLVSDCVALLTARYVLAGTATLNWSTDTPIADWSGVVLEGTPGRVTELRLRNLGLTGEIPPELGNLSDLQHLNLSDNNLTGGIPTELGDLSNLQELYLGGNRLSGCVPDELRDIPSNDFASLDLPFCSQHPCVSGGAVVDTSNPGLLSDCEMLLAARDTLAGTAALNWAANIPITEWDGATVHRTQQRVTELNLSNRELAGEIPSELGNLASLQRLSLYDNQLTGEIPTELGNLHNLHTLSLFDNQLENEIPAELGRLAELRSLSLSNNQLTGEIPTELGNLENVESLFLSNNQLTGEIPTELGSLDNLQSLGLFGNELTGEIPAELGNLAKLWWLGLWENELTGEIPAELRNLANLQTLWLGGNQLTGEIPTELGSLSNLQGLALFDNQLSGEIPPELGRLISLSDLLLNHNDLEGSIPSSLGRLRNLERFWLRSNRLTGCVPPRLRYVPDNDFDQQGLSFCALSPPDAPTIGSVTPELDSLTISWAPPLNDGGSDITAYDLRYIETDGDETVDSNWTVVEDVWTPGRGALGYRLTGLTGGIQYDIQVRAVNAEGDSPWSETVTGTPSSSVCVSGGAVADATNSGLISDCEALIEGRDTLAGTATLNWSEDTSIAQWEGVGLGGTPQRVTRVELAGKGLDGTISSELGRLSKLTYLNLRSNELTGEIPDALGNLVDLRVLNLHSNSHSGSIPNLSGMTSLEELYLANNAVYDADDSKIDGTGLTGEIPTWLNGMTNMRELWLWGNSLSGSIPDLSGMTSLKKLKLANNDLTGGVPQASELPPNMTWLIIDRNPLGGTIPDLSSLTRLKLLWLHSNELEGSIPAGSMFPASLDDLNLRDNMLTGEISDLSNLDTLTRLRLHNNSLSGEVPATLGGLDSLKYLWLHNEVEKGLGSNMLTSIAAGVGDLAGTLIVITLDGNPWDADACVPDALADVAKNDYAEAGIEVCSGDDGS